MTRTSNESAEYYLSRRALAPSASLNPFALTAFVTSLQQLERVSSLNGTDSFPQFYQKPISKSRARKRTRDSIKKMVKGFRRMLVQNLFKSQDIVEERDLEAVAEEGELDVIPPKMTRNISSGLPVDIETTFSPLLPKHNYNLQCPTPVESEGLDSDESLDEDQTRSVEEGSGGSLSSARRSSSSSSSSSPASSKQVRIAYLITEVHFPDEGDDRTPIQVEPKPKYWRYEDELELEELEEQRQEQEQLRRRRAAARRGTT